MTDEQQDFSAEMSESEGVPQAQTPGDDLNIAEGTDDALRQTRPTDGGGQDTFPREYVQKLRDENAKYRQRAQKSDELAKRLHTALVGATGRLQDATDLPFDETHLEDPESLNEAITELLERKPHLASRKPTGSIGQGVTTTAKGVDLAALLRSRA